MTMRAILGVLALNAVLLVVGVAVLHALRPYRAVSEVVRLGGLAYLLGVSTTAIAFTFALAVGLPLGAVGMLVTLGLLLAGAVLIGRARGHHAPPLHWSLAIPSISPLAALAGAGLVVYLESLFRVGRLTGLYEWDGWAFWVPKALTIHHFGGLEGSWFFTLPGPSYPPNVPALEAAAFHFMGTTDPVTLHLLFWCLHVGFLWALLGLLWSRVRQSLLLPCVLAVAVIPDIVRRVLDAQGDLLVGQLVAVAAVVVLLWLDDRRQWHLPAATLLLAGAMLTKREGLLLAVCVVVAAAVATWPIRRNAWPRLGAVLACAFLASVPWRIWFVHNGLPSDAPPDGFLGLFDHLDRAWPSFELSLRTQFAFNLWRLTGVLLIVGAVLAALAGRRRLGVYAITLFLLTILGAAWVVWSIPDLPITRDGAVNPIIRLVGSAVLLSAALLPLLLERAWTASEPLPVLERIAGFVPPLPRATGALVLVGALLVYPAALLVRGGPTFHTAADCRPAATGEGPIRAVFGRFTTMQEALVLVDRVREVGYKNANAEPDGCGLVRVAVHGVPSIEGGHDLQREAGTVALDPTLERDD
jgi:hypothetical protein